MITLKLEKVSSALGKDQNAINSTENDDPFGGNSNKNKGGYNDNGNGDDIIDDMVDEIDDELHFD